MADTIRVGMIGLDTSHCPGFTQLLNEKQPEAGARVVAGYPSFSPDVESSVGRVEKYTEELRGKYGVKITKSIDELLDAVDVVMLTSVDGRRHLAELRPVAAAGKPVFIDKPFAASLADAAEMVKLIKQTKLPCFSCSSLRFDSGFTQFVADKEKHGEILGCDAWGPAHLEKTNPGFFWYGIHGVEILYTIMGTGCKSVSCSSTPDGDLAVGVWSADRLGSMRGIRKGKQGYGAVVLTEKAPLTMLQAKGDYFAGLAKEMIKFFKTHEPPVPIDETLEICAFIDASLRSTQQDCDDIKLKTV